ncbi:hypothetical protein JD844_005559 [Phrynosoma platyrhinos]|uniref:SAM domain-containing protein n=1 Tax=Phrynosoma platyrhinos TaxID=52577 RepID=A0ABQ7TP60_PHRPL|nr:hypothetical protein JD844_005559 [Phrynosoma platyrhinos]
MFDCEQHTLNLPAVNSITYVLRFLEKLCHNLHSDNLFGNQPFTQHHVQHSREYEHDRYLPDRSISLDGSLQGPGRGSKRYSQDSPPYSAPLSPKLPKNDHHPLEGETFVLSDGLPGPLEPRLDPMDSALNAFSAATPSRNTRHYRLQGYRHLHQHSNLSQCGTSAMHRLSVVGSDRYLGPRDCSRLGTRDPSAWTVEDVMQFVREADPQLGPHADLFRKHRVDMQGLLLSRPKSLYEQFESDSLPFGLAPSKEQRSESSILPDKEKQRSPHLHSDSLLVCHTCKLKESVKEIDGKALLLLRSDMMMKYMGLKLGPTLKLTYHIDRLKQGKF